MIFIIIIQPRPQGGVFNVLYLRLANGYVIFGVLNPDMKKYYCLLIVLLILYSALSAQKITPVIQWQKSLGGSKIDRAYTVIRTVDHGYLMVGESFSNDGNVTGHHGSTDSSDA